MYAYACRPGSEARPRTRTRHRSSLPANRNHEVAGSLATEALLDQLGHWREAKARLLDLDGVRALRRAVPHQYHQPSRLETAYPALYGSARCAAEDMRCGRGTPRTSSDHDREGCFCRVVSYRVEYFCSDFRCARLGPAAFPAFGDSRWTRNRRCRTSLWSTDVMHTLRP